MAKIARKGLGKGLSALLGDDRPIVSNDDVAGADGTLGPVGRRRLPIEFLVRNVNQPRVYFDEESLDELSTSIKEKGLLQPILVRQLEAEKFQIVAGERRWRAAQKAGIHEVPVVVRDLTDSEVLELAIIENIQRRDLTSIEEARGYRRLMTEFNHTQEAVGDIVGKSRSHITNLLRLLNLPEKVQRYIDEGLLSMGHARALVGRDNAEELAVRIVKEGLSVRQIEAISPIKQEKQKRQPRPGGTSGAKKDADTIALEKDLSAALGMKVTIEHDGETGRVSISYASLDELDDLCSKLGVCGF